MGRLESIKQALAEYKTDEDLLSPPEQGYLKYVSYILQRLERYETTLQKITHTTTHMQAKFFAQESLKEGNS